MEGGLGHSLPHISPKINEKNVDQIEAGLVKESLLHRSCIDETILC